MSSQNWIFFVISITFRVFPFKRSMYQMGFFGGGLGECAKISNIFWVCLINPIFFFFWGGGGGGLNSRYWVQA